MIHIAKEKLLFLLCLILPFFVLGLITITNFQAQNSGTLWRVGISGYDPRDLLHGRFLRYQINWDKYGQVSYVNDKKSHLCLNGTKGSLTPQITIIKDTELKGARCASIIASGLDAKNWNIRDRQYYIPEKHADVLDKAFRSRKYKFEIDIRIGSNNKMSIGSLYIDDKSMAQALPKLTKTYGKEVKHVSHDWRFRVHNFKTYHISNTQQCFAYEINWPAHGHTPLSTGKTEELCINKSADGSNIAKVSVKPEMGEAECLSIATSGDWANQSNWNYPMRSICYDLKKAAFFKQQLENNPENLFLQNTMGQSGNFYGTQIYIGTQSLNKAYKENK